MKTQLAFKTVAAVTLSFLLISSVNVLTVNAQAQTAIPSPVVESTNAPTVVVPVTESPVVMGIVSPTFSPVSVIDVDYGDGEFPTSNEPTGSLAPSVATPSSPEADTILSPTIGIVNLTRSPTFEVPTNVPTETEMKKVLGTGAIIGIALFSPFLLFILWYCCQICLMCCVFGVITCGNRHQYRGNR